MRGKVTWYKPTLHINDDVYQELPEVDKYLVTVINYNWKEEQQFNSSTIRADYLTQCFLMRPSLSFH